MALHWKIIIGLAVGTLLGLVGVWTGAGGYISDWIYPLGKIFLALLKVIAVPLIFASLINGIASVKDITKLSKMGGKTVLLYIASTVIAVTVGLLIVNGMEPGTDMPQATKDALLQKYATTVEQRSMVADQTQSDGPLQFLVEVVPDNILSASGDNKNMLKVIFFAVFLGVGSVAVGEKGKPVLNFFESLNAVVLKMVDFIMLFAPIGVFGLMAGLMVDLAGDEPASVWGLLLELGYYALAVILGLLTMTLVVYPLILWLLTGRNPVKFFKQIMPAQLLALSTSSSAATLPVTMERCEKGLGINKEVTSFVLPVGATINMDGTSLYQAVAAVFIANAYGLDLGLSEQLTIVLTATLASIGSAAVPGAGVVMLIIVLNSIGLPAEGVALILAPDRILDMLRTTVNVTGDATVASLIGKGYSDE